MKRTNLKNWFLLLVLVMVVFIGFGHVSEAYADEEENVSEDGELVAEGEAGEALKKSIAQLHFESEDGKYTNISENPNEAGENSDEASETPGSAYVKISGGTFTVNLKASDLGLLPAEEGSEEKPSIKGVKVLCVDISGVKQLLNDYNFKYEVSDVEVSCDGNPIELDMHKLVLGSAEENDNLRIEIYNANGATAGENAPIDSSSFEFSDKLSVTFTLKLVSKGQNAYIVFANGKGRYFSTPEKPKSEPVVIGDNGTYTLSLEAIDSEGDKVKVSGISNFYVAIPGLVNQINNWTDLRVVDVSITCDGEPVEVDSSEIYWGNTKNNGDFRIDLYDESKNNGEYKGALDRNKFNFRDRMNVTFTIEGLEVGFPNEVVEGYEYIEPAPEEPEIVEPEITEAPEVSEAPTVSEAPVEPEITEVITPTPETTPSPTPAPIRGLNDNKVDKSSGLGGLAKFGIVLGVIIVLGGGAAAIKFGKE